jgi:hypothetical protein
MLSHRETEDPGTQCPERLSGTPLERPKRCVFCLAPSARLESSASERTALEASGVRPQSAFYAAKTKSPAETGLLSSVFTVPGEPSQRRPTPPRAWRRRGCYFQKVRVSAVCRPWKPLHEGMNSFPLVDISGARICHPISVPFKRKAKIIHSNAWPVAAIAAGRKSRQHASGSP